MNLNTLRRNGQKYFSAHGFPTRKDENWKYTSVKEIQEKSFAPAALQRKNKIPQAIQKNILNQLNKELTNLVFYNGSFVEELSDLKDLKGKAEIFPLSLAKNVILKIKSQRKEVKSLRQDAFEALNSSHLQDGIAFVLKKNQSLKKPVALSYFNDCSLKSIFPKNFFILESGSKLACLQEYYGQEDYFIDPVSEFLIEDSATLHWTELQNNSLESFHVSCARFLLKKNAAADLLTMSLGAKLSRHNLDVHLLEAGASAHVNGLYLAGRDQHVDHHTYIDHQVGQCQSQQLYKGLLNNNARAVFDGKVFIQKQAQGANSEQLNKTLLLSSQAEIDSKPQLQIDADDVKATHGTTVGQLDEEEVFYLQSRAIEKNVAIEMLSLGFVRDLIDRVEDKNIKNYLDEQLKKAYQQLTKGAAHGK